MTELEIALKCERLESETLVLRRKVEDLQRDKAYQAECFMARKQELISLGAKQQKEINRLTQLSVFGEQAKEEFDLWCGDAGCNGAYKDKDCIIPYDECCGFAEVCKALGGEQ